MAINNPNIRDLLQQRSETIAIEPSEVVTLMERLNLAVASGSYPEVVWEIFTSIPPKDIFDRHARCLRSRYDHGHESKPVA